jgi:hypothetical protein
VSDLCLLWRFDRIRFLRGIGSGFGSACLCLQVVLVLVVLVAKSRYCNAFSCLCSGSQRIRAEANVEGVYS